MKSIATKLRCPSCGRRALNRVIDTRPSPDGEYVRRLRVCARCEHRVTTHEVVAGSGHAREARWLRRIGKLLNAIADRISLPARIGKKKRKGVPRKMAERIAAAKPEPQPLTIPWRKDPGP